MGKSGSIWFDGKFVPFEKANIHLLSHALHYGSGVYEGIRAYQTPNGPAIFRLKDHVDRLFQSAAVLHMKVPYSKETIARAILSTVARNHLRECYIRPIIFYGEGQMTLFPRGAELHVAIATWPWGAYLGEHKALSVCISSYVRFHPKSIIFDAKISGLYAIATIATIDAREHGFDECIMLDHEGSVAEGPGENIFIVKKGKLFMPNSRSVLRGLTRDSIMKIAHDMDLPVSEKKISVRELMAADEAFFTGTATEVAAIVKVDGKKIGTGKIGPITEKMRSTYLAAVHGKIPKYKKWLTEI